MRADPLLIVTRILLLAIALVAGSLPGAAQRYLVHSYTEEEGLPVSETFDVGQDPQGRIWCATRAGIVAYDGSTWEFVRDQDGGLIRDAFILRFDSRGRAWIFKRSGHVLVWSQDGGTVLAANEALRARNTTLLDADVLASAQPDVCALASYDRELFLWDARGWRAVPGVSDRIGTLRAVEAAAESFYLGGDAGLVALDPDGTMGPAIALPAGVDGGIRGLLGEPGGRLWVQGRDWIGVLAADGVELIAADVPDPVDVTVTPLVQVADGRGGLYYGNTIGLFHFDRASGQVERLGRASGLVAEGVRGLHLDGEGLLWIATPLGLSKLVGRQWATYGPAEGLLRGETSALEELADGDFVLGHNDGLSFHSAGTFEAFSFERDLEGGPGRTRVLDLHTDPTGVLWIAASALGLGRLEPDRSLTWLTIPEACSGWATTVLRDRGGSLWVGTPGGLLRLHGEELLPVDEPGLRGRYVRCIVEAPDGRLLVGAEPGVWIRERGRWALAEAEHKEQGRGLFAILVDDHGRTWVGARDGLWELKDARLVRTEVALPADRAVYTLVQDLAGRLWIGSDFGVFRFDGRQLEHFTVREGLSGNETNRAAGLVDRQGNVWLGTEKGLSVFRPALEPSSAPPLAELSELELQQRLHPVSEPLRVGPGPHELVFRARARTLIDEHGLRWRTRLEGYEERWQERKGTGVLEVRQANLPPGHYRLHVAARQGEGPWGPAVSSATITVVGPIWTRWWFYIAAVVVTAGLGASLHRLLAQQRHARDLEDQVRRRSEELAASQRELARTERLRSLGILAGGIAHDFNNVLTALMGSLSLLRLRLAGEHEHEDLLDTCDRALQRAQQLSTQLLTFAKGGEPVTKAIGVAQLVEDSTRLVLSGSTVRCELDLAADLWPIRADPAQIYQAFENLLLNARQAMRAGGAVRVRARNLEVGAGQTGDLRPGRYVRLELADEGPGIPPEALPRVFEPFFTTKPGGSGLGLATAHSVVERHGGRLGVRSPPGAGATFTLDLPAAEDPPAAAADPDPPTDTLRRPGHVLVMDDEPVVRALLSEILKALGREATVSASGEEALTALADAGVRGLHFSCAILDLTVPGAMGGREALARLRALDPTLPAIATSGYTEDAVLARPQEFGFQGALAKPFRVADVAAILADVERRRSA